ncbi:TRAP transporter small permease [Metabacillus arenae]|uniref:TRAP transporter small permease n=1 Tax=Metabacillus arenae TaxID=2771434 RepID=A0A926NJW4_9BACI|nr:TRAP transporter small permease [Metabacillus arenae]MBD1382420.1 TRAP transporter small permease [Metabacillus arenae]
MKKISIFFTGFVNMAMAGSLAMMFCLVIGNVILRYVFNSGITWSEEVSRFLFILLSFLGAIIALKNNEHLSVDTVLRRLPSMIRKIVNGFSILIMLYILYILFDGSVKMTIQNITTLAPATGISMAFIFGIGILTSIGMAIILISNLFKTFIKIDIPKKKDNQNLSNNSPTGDEVVVK